MAVLTSLNLNEVNDLRNEANAFQGHADELKAVTDNMLETVRSTSSVLQGEVQEAFATKFDGLSDDFAYIYEMCTEYATDLTDIADNYDLANQYNKDAVSTLKSDLGLKRI